MPETGIETREATIVHQHVSTTIQQPEPMSWEGCLADHWKFFKQKFTLYMQATRSSNEPPEYKASLLLSCIGDRALKIYNNFSYEEGEKNMDFDVIVNKFENYFNPEKNVTYERHMFLIRDKKENETMDNYITDLRDLSTTCEFEHLTDSLITSKLILGLKSDIDLQNKLIRTKNLTLGKAVEICRVAERTKEQLEKISATNKMAENKGHSIDKIKKTYKRNDNNVKKLPTVPVMPSSSKSPMERRSQFNSPANVNNKVRVPVQPFKFNCYKCGKYHGKNQCPAYGKTCMKCKKINHFAKMCKSVNEINMENVFYIDSIETNNSDMWKTIIEVHNGTKINFKLDTGAQVNIIPAKFLKELKIHENNLIQENTKLSTYTGNNIKILGKCILKCKVKDRSTYLTFYIVNESNVQPILGKVDCEKLNIIKLVEAVETQNNDNSNKYENVINNFSDVFCGIGCLEGTYKIEIDPNVKPVIHAPRKVPIAIQNKLKNKLKMLEKNKIIAKVDKPTEWVNPLVIVNKPNGDIRICMDPKDLNNAIKREYFPMPTVDDIVSKLNGAKFFSILDASDAFYQIKLDYKSSLLCTFNTPYGRYRFLRLPYGITLASEIFQKKIKFLFENIEGTESYIDDFLVWGKTKEEHDKRLINLLTRCKEINLKLNLKKCKFGTNEIMFLGHKISDKGIQPDYDKILAIKNYKKPSCKKDIERFLGMITYVSKFIPNLSYKTEHLRNLLKSDIQWHWEEHHEKSFNELKEILCTKPILQFYDINKPVVVSVDSSQSAIGAVLLQNNLPIYYASKALTETQKNWAPIERETMAVLFGLERFHQFVYARNKITVESDHKPLSSIMKKPLNSCPPRLQRMLIQIQKYDINLVYKPGCKMFLADALSRAHNEKIKMNSNDLNFDKILEEKLSAQVCLITKTLNVTDKKLIEIKNEIKQDEEMLELIELTKNGWPEKKTDIKEIVKIYFPFNDEISYHDGILFKNQRIIIPKTLRNSILTKLHVSHLGKEKTKNRAREIVYWPGMSRDIDNLVANCQACATYARSNQKEPLKQHDIPQRAWQKVAMDIFEIKRKYYLVLVDYFSKFPEVVRLDSLTSEALIYQLKNIFSRQGIPDIVFSDNGPQMSSHLFKCFANEWEFEHKTSSPKHSRSNGLVERTIQTVQNIIKKCEMTKNDPFIALLELRNTPIYANVNSPSQLLNQRSLKSILPVTQKHLKPIKIKTNTFKKVLKEKQKKQKYYYDKNAKVLPEIEINKNVYVKSRTKNIPGKILNKTDRPRSYNIKMFDTGREIERNRKDIINRNTNEIFYKKSYLYNNESSEDESDSNIDNNSIPSSIQGRKSDGLTCSMSNVSEDINTPGPSGLKSYKTRFGRHVKPPERLNA